MRETKGPSGLTRDELLARCGMSDQARELVDAHIEAEVCEALLSGAIGKLGRDKVLEEAAALADEEARHYFGPSGDDVARAKEAHAIAKQIRALKSR